MREVATEDWRGNPRVQTINTDESKTIQSDAHLANINVIMSAILEEGRDILDDAELMFGDVSDFGDYQDVMQEVKRAEETFMALPSKVREVFDHSVSVWLDTAHDDDKRQKLVEAGFLKPVAKVPPVDPQMDPTTGAPRPPPVPPDGGDGTKPAASAAE